MMINRNVNPQKFHYFFPDTEAAKHKGYYAQKDLLNDALLHEGTFASLKSRPTSPAMPPTGTAMPTGASFDLSIKTPTPRSGSPSVRTVSPSPQPQTENQLPPESIVRPRPANPKFTQPEWVA